MNYQYSTNLSTLDVHHVLTIGVSWKEILFAHTKMGRV